MAYRSEKFRLYVKEYYQTHRKEISEHSRQYREAHKEEIKRRSSERREKNRDKINEAQRVRYHLHKEEILKKRRENYHSNIEENRKKKNKYAKDHKEQINGYHRRRRLNPIHKLKENLRTKIFIIFRKMKYKKPSKTKGLLGSDYNFIKGYIEKQFTEGMSWENYGQWHIDHIIPLSSAKNSRELKKLCHYTNLQPLWAKDNIEKRDKIDWIKDDKKFN